MMERRRTKAKSFDIGAAATRSDVESPGAGTNAFSGLDDDAVRRRWRRLLGRPLPQGLGRGLTLRILAYYQQVQQHGDLDRASLQILADSTGMRRKRPDPAMQADPSAGTIRVATIVRPGTLLVREHDGISHRVMVLEDGFAWNGKTYDSLSKVASAITGTRWNGPRFFGLRDRPKGEKEGHPQEPRTSMSQGRAAETPGGADATVLPSMPQRGILR